VPGIKNQNDGAIGPTKKFDDVFSRVDTIHQSDRLVDRDRHRTTAKTALMHRVTQ